MARPRRRDLLNCWVHLMNQGVGKRTLFDHRQDVRLFESKLARVVRRGDLEVHAFCVMPNHYHALVRSLCGRLSAAVQWFQDGFARYFNRTRHRVGGVFRGRFRSELVESADYWHTLVWYIDQNPVLDGLVEHPAEYPWSSAALYARPAGPLWLRRDLVQTLHYDREEALAQGLSPERRDRVLRFMQQRATATPTDRDPLDLLLHGATDQVRRWIENRALNADGIRPGIPVVTPGTVMELVTEDMTVAEVPLERQIMGAWALVTLCGSTREGAALTLGIARSTARTRLRQFRERAERDPGWLPRAEEFLQECLARDHPFRDLSERSQPRLFRPGETE